MPDSPPHHFRVPKPLAVLVALVGVGIVAAADYVSTRHVNPTSLYVIPMIVAAGGMYRKLLWSVAALSVALALGLYRILPGETTPDADRAFLTNRAIVSVGLLMVAGLLHAFVGVYRKLERGREILQKRREELEAINAELGAREEEITSQNEELQSQTEELERQSEELRVANEELARRERTLDVLLALSRALTTELSREQTMTRICQTLGEIIDHGTAAAILLREGDKLHVACTQGFGDDAEPRVERVPYHQSFASLVLERNRTGFLEDVSLRPELRFVHPKSAKPFQSVLATPLRVNGQAVGTLEAYGVEKGSWSDEQIAMLESLAAQTSISLEAADLYERVEQERTRLQAVLETVPFGVMIASADLTDVRLNPAGAAMRRVSPNVNLIPTRDLARWRLFHNGTPVEEDEHPLFRAVRAGESIHNREYELVVDGRTRSTLLYSAAPIRDAQGRVLGGVAASADITEQKRLQLELDARRREAEEASVRKTRFLAAVSHDIRTPANAISLLAELMQRTASSPALAGEIPEIAADLRNSAMTLVNLVSDVLDLTRFDSGRIDLEESEFSLDALVNDECRQLGALAREKGLTFTCHPPPRPITVRADRVKLSRILGNLISNAVKFTGEGGVTVVAGGSPEEGVFVRVTDTGPGVPAEYRERIFDEFFQLKHVGSHNGGSGLGLAICRRLAQAMGGSITVESRLAGGGSTFTLALPPSTIVPR